MIVMLMQTPDMHVYLSVVCVYLASARMYLLVVRVYVASARV